MNNENLFNSTVNFYNINNENFIEFLSKFYGDILDIKSNDEIHKKLINELFLLYNEFNEKGIDEKILKDKIDLFLENKQIIKKLDKLKNDTEEIKTETNNIRSQLDTKANKNEIFTMANMGQDIKEAMTGGSVAVVSGNSVGIETANIDLKNILGEYAVDLNSYEKFNQQKYTHAVGNSSEPNYQYFWRHVVYGEKIKFSSYVKTGIDIFVFTDETQKVITYETASVDGEYNREILVPVGAKRVYFNNDWSKKTFTVNKLEVVKNVNIRDIDNNINEVKNELNEQIISINSKLGYSSKISTLNSYNKYEEFHPTSSIYVGYGTCIKAPNLIKGISAYIYSDNGGIATCEICDINFNLLASSSKHVNALTSDFTLFDFDLDVSKYENVWVRFIGDTTLKIRRNPVTSNFLVADIPEPYCQKGVNPWNTTSDPSYTIPFKVITIIQSSLNAKNLPKPLKSLVGDGVTDDTVALQNAIDYLKEIGGGKLFFPAATYLLNGDLKDIDVYNSIIKIPYNESVTAPPISIVLEGEYETASAYPENTAVPPIAKSTIFYVKRNHDVTGSFPSVFGSKFKSTDNSFNNSTYTDITLYLKNFIIRQKNNGNLTDLQLKYVANVVIENVVSDVDVDGQECSYPTDTRSRGLVLPTLNNYALVRVRNYYAIGRYTGIIHNEHANLDNIFIQRCNRGIRVEQAHHGCYYGKILMQNVHTCLSANGDCRIYGGVLNVENDGKTTVIIDDENNAIYGDIKIHNVRVGVGAKNTYEDIMPFVKGASNLKITTEEKKSVTIVHGDVNATLNNLINALVKTGLIKLN